MEFKALLKVLSVIVRLIENVSRKKERNKDRQTSLLQFDGTC